MSKVKGLDEMMPGERGRVAVVSSCGALRCRMMEMGLVKGAELEVVRLAPSGDPVEILLKGYSLALRKREAVNITLVVD
ncbi:MULTISPECIES: FeoA family protein [Methanothrix]|jgi:Fe2+ transport system protein FeoA|uniref:FeoA family protein n=1 Tax=Methanothrix TaxID=2222 RepID=UPI0027AF7493|nr:FeoA family protein [Methanothrix soehngenii]MDQ1313407.1 ferrous iron transport protein [Euryarchaeota archaeon]